MPPRPPNLESFLYSDAPTGPSNSNVGPQVRSNGDFQVRVRNKALWHIPYCSILDVALSRCLCAGFFLRGGTGRILKECLVSVFFTGESFIHVFPASRRAFGYCNLMESCSHSLLYRASRVFSSALRCCQLAQKGEAPPARSSSSGATTGGEDHSRGGFERKRAGVSAGGSKSGEDLLNFGNDPHGGGAGAGAGAGVTGRAAAAAAAGRPSGRSSSPPGWGPRSGRGAASPTPQTPAGRMQGRPGAPSNGVGAGGSGGAASGGVHPGGSSNGGGRQTHFGGAPGGPGGGGSAGEPDLMNVNAGGGAGGGARPEGEDRSSYVQSKVAEREREVERATKRAVQFKKVCV